MRAVSEESWVINFEQLYGNTDIEDDDKKEINKEYEWQQYQYQNR